MRVTSFGTYRGPRAHARESGQVIVLILILLALAGGGYWMLLSLREKKEGEARAFARETATRVVLQQDVRFLDRTLAPSAQTHYPPSWRERLIVKIRDLGAPQSEPLVTGQVYFASQFFDPTGTFRAEVRFPSGPGILEFTISHPHALWQIDAINWTWTPPAPPAPPTPLAIPTPSPSPARR